jgi:hypothetical protein
MNDIERAFGLKVDVLNSFEYFSISIWHLRWELAKKEVWDESLWLFLGKHEYVNSLALLNETWFGTY